MTEISVLANRITDKDRLLSMGRVLPAGTHTLDRGDPDFPTPEHICDAAREAMAQGYTHYIPGYGDKDLIQAICENLHEDYGCGFEPNGVLITNGGAEAIFLACAAFLSPGDEAIVFSPGYGLYGGSIQMVGATPIWVPLKEDFHIDRDALRKAITPQTKAIFFSNPSNPTGIAFSQEEIQFLAEIAMEHDLLLVPDEVYKKFYYGDHIHHCVGSIPEIRDRLIMIDSFSKTYAMTGWRIGYVATTAELAEPMYAIHRTTVSCVNWPAQRAALAALQGPQDSVHAMVQEYDRRRIGMQEKLKDVPRFDYVTPTSAFYILGRYDSPMKAGKMVEYLIERGVAVKGGAEFGPTAEGCIRLTFATDYDDALKGIEKLGAIFRDMP